MSIKYSPMTNTSQDVSVPPSIRSTLKSHLRVNISTVAVIGAISLLFAGAAVWIRHAQSDNLATLLGFVAELHSDPLLLKLIGHARWTSTLWMAGGLVTFLLISLLGMFGALMLIDIPATILAKILWRRDRSTLEMMRSVDKGLIQLMRGRQRYHLIVGLPSIGGMLLAVSLFWFLGTPLLTLTFPLCLGFSGSIIVSGVLLRKVVQRMGLKVQQLRKLIQVQGLVVGTYILSLLLIVPLLLLGIVTSANNVLPRFWGYSIGSWILASDRASTLLEPTQAQAIQRILEDFRSSAESLNWNISEILEDSGLNVFLWFMVAAIIILVFSLPLVFQGFRISSSRRGQIGLSVVTAILIFGFTQFVSISLQKDLPISQPLLVAVIAGGYVVLITWFMNTLAGPWVAPSSLVCTRLKPNGEQCSYENKPDARFCGGCGAPLTPRGQKSPPRETNDGELTRTEA